MSATNAVTKSYNFVTDSSSKRVCDTLLKNTSLAVLSRFGGLACHSHMHTAVLRTFLARHLFSSVSSRSTSEMANLARLVGAENGRKEPPSRKEKGAGPLPIGRYSWRKCRAEQRALLALNQLGGGHV